MKIFSLQYSIVITTLSIILLGLVLGTGCSRTASSREVILNLEIKVTFEGNIDRNNFNYYFVFSGIGTPDVPTPDLREYFPTPGRAYNETTLLYEYPEEEEDPLKILYPTYFSSWSDYIVLDDTGRYLYKSGVNSFDSATTKETHNKYDYDRNVTFDLYTSNNSLRLVLQIQDLSLSSNKIYFNFLTTEKTSVQDFDAGFMRDILRTSFDIANIKVQGREEISQTNDIENGDVDPPADIISWEARVF